MTEIADRELERMVEKRSSRNGEGRGLDARIEQAHVRRVARFREANRWEWIRFHERMAELHLKIAQQHQEKARRLAS